MIFIIIISMDFDYLKDKLIVGLLSTSQQVKYGKTSNGKPIFQVKPLDSKLPNFWLTYGGSLKGKIVVVFKFKQYKEGTLPFGEIYNIIGLATDENLAKALMYHYQINRKCLKSTELNLNSNETIITRKDLTQLDIFSIDPEGCIDIDDALSIEKIENGYSIGVHIAQPICWLTKDEITKRAEEAFSTLYFNSNEELWSKEIVGKASLFQNEKKPAYSIIFTIRDNIIKSIESYPSWIINKLNTSYEKIDYPQIKLLNEVSNTLFDKILDSHELVSEWMIQANNYIGQTFKNIPFRVQNSNSYEKENISDEIKNIFSMFEMESAEYSFEKEYHTSLGLNKYTHFTSPIRRIIDTMIHYIITYNDVIEINIERINFLDKQTKKFHRQIKLNEIINNLSLTIEGQEIDGWIYKKEQNKWLVYFKELGLIKVKIIDDKLNYLINPELINQYKIGSNYKFKIYKKPGFLPKEKILIVSTFNLL